MRRFRSSNVSWSFRASGAAKIFVTGTPSCPWAQIFFAACLIRVSQAPIVEAADLGLVRWTENPIYEICTNPAVYTAFEKTMAQAKG